MRSQDSLPADAQRDRFPSAPRSWRQGSQQLPGRYDPDTSDIVLMFVIVLSVILLVGGSFYLGLGEGSACTDVPGNGGFGEPPCNRVAHAVWTNVILQGCLFVTTVVAGGRTRWRQWIAWGLLICSLAGFGLALVMARSY